MNMPAANPLGLAERRAIKEYQEKNYVDLKEKIDDAAGFELPVEVDWQSIATAGESDKYDGDDYWTKVYFEPLIRALQSITADDLGKQALKERLRKLVIRRDANAPASNYAAGLAFADGVLAVNWIQYSNSGDVNERTGALMRFLESKL